MPTMIVYVVSVLFLLLSALHPSEGLIEHHHVFSSRKVNFNRPATRVQLQSGAGYLSQGVEVVLFGIGDLRTDDHEGLMKAVEKAADSQSRLLPIAVLDEESLSRVPGAVAHTLDTASMISAALEDLRLNLAKMNLDLHVAVGGDNLSGQLTEVLQSFPGDTKVTVHACDLGDADNSMQYGPFSNLVNLPSNVHVEPWSCQLWNDASSNLAATSYTEFEERKSNDSNRPVVNSGQVDDQARVQMEQYMTLPQTQELCELMQAKLDVSSERCLAEQNTGLYGTHWGGIDSNSVAESWILDTIATYVEDCSEDDAVFGKVSIPCTRNSNSLEHATMVWSMKGEEGSEEDPVTNNMIAGERLTRLLLAPLFLGTISPRRVWHSMKKNSLFFKNPIKTLVETREWHKLLARQNMQTEKSYMDGGNEGPKYRYWRWHGFLCRYLEADVMKSSSSAREGLILVHGFGASGSQWTKTIGSMQDYLEMDAHTQCLAPDLIGFGHSEKPPITYAGYTWEAYMSDFVKEVAVQRCGMDSFVVGGNSIGGFVSICAAANDASIEQVLSGNGAPGTGKCNGAVLMNPAGVIQSKEDVAAIEASSNGAILQSVAQATATGALPPCKPLPRPVARAFGTGLLAYLRPRIQEICVNLYPTNPDAVNEELCETILRDSLDPGAINVMISGSKLPAPRTYNEVIAADFGQSRDSSSLPESTFRGPILMAQGILDPLNDAKGRAESLGTLRSGIQIDQLQGGHCPHDEIPDGVAQSIAAWMTTTRDERKKLTEKYSLQVN